MTAIASRRGNIVKISNESEKKIFFGRHFTGAIDE
jgi:hypothetical protein